MNSLMYREMLNLLVFYVVLFGVNNEYRGYDLTSGIFLLFFQNPSSCQITCVHPQVDCGDHHAYFASWDYSKCYFTKH